MANSLHLNDRIPTDPTTLFVLIVSLWLAHQLSAEEAASLPLLLPAVRDLLTSGRR